MWCYGEDVASKMKSFRKAYEGELVAIGEEKWCLVEGKIADVTNDWRHTYMGNDLAEQLMKQYRSRTGMPPFCVINGSLTWCVCALHHLTRSPKRLPPI